MSEVTSSQSLSSIEDQVQEMSAGQVEQELGKFYKIAYPGGKAEVSKKHFFQVQKRDDSQWSVQLEQRSRASSLFSRLRSNSASENTENTVTRQFFTALTRRLVSLAGEQEVHRSSSSGSDSQEGSSGVHHLGVRLSKLDSSLLIRASNRLKIMTNSDHQKSFLTVEDVRGVLGRLDLFSRTDTARFSFKMLRTWNDEGKFEKIACGGGSRIGGKVLSCSLAREKIEWPAPPEPEPEPAYDVRIDKYGIRHYTPRTTGRKKPVPSSESKEEPSSADSGKVDYRYTFCTNDIPANGSHSFKKYEAGDFVIQLASYEDLEKAWPFILHELTASGRPSSFKEVILDPEKNQVRLVLYQDSSKPNGGFFEARRNLEKISDALEGHEIQGMSEEELWQDREISEEEQKREQEWKKFPKQMNPLYNPSNQINKRELKEDILNQYMFFEKKDSPTSSKQKLLGEGVRDSIINQVRLSYTAKK